MLNKVNIDTIYYSKTSEWAYILNFTPLEIRKAINENLLDTTKEFIAQMYESSENVTPKIEKLISISFNIEIIRTR